MANKFGPKSHGRVGLAMCLSRKGSARRLLEARFQTGTVCSVLEQFVLAASPSKYSAGVRNRSRKRIATRRKNEPQARIVLTLLISRGYRAFEGWNRLPGAGTDASNGWQGK
jgi:hypothetical protein